MYLFYREIIFFLSIEKIYMTRSFIFLSLSLFPEFCEHHSYIIVLLARELFIISYKKSYTHLI